MKRGSELTGESAQPEEGKQSLNTDKWDRMGNADQEGGNNSLAFPLYEIVRLSQLSLDSA